MIPSKYHGFWEQVLSGSVGITENELNPDDDLLEEEDLLEDPDDVPDCILGDISEDEVVR